MEDLLVMRIVSFLIDHGVDIMLVPKDLKTAVEEKLTNMTKTHVSVTKKKLYIIYTCINVYTHFYINVFPYKM